MTSTLEVDQVLIQRASLCSDGANVHRLNNLCAAYVNSLQLARLNKVPEAKRTRLRTLASEAETEIRILVNSIERQRSQTRLSLYPGFCG